MRPSTVTLLRKFRRFRRLARAGLIASVALAVGSVALFAFSRFRSPSAAEGAHALTQQIAEQSHGLIRLVTFSKVEGTAHRRKTYELEYLAEIEFLEDCLWSGGLRYRWGGAFNAFRGPPSEGVAPAPELIGKERARKGEHEKVSGALWFEKSEVGWKSIPPPGASR